MRRIVAVAVKELRQLVRDRLTLAMMVAIPIVQLLVFGWAINTDVRHIPTVVLDHDGSSHSRELVHSLEATGSYEILGAVVDEAAVHRALRSGTARVAIVIDARFGQDLERGETARVQLVVDGSDPQTVASATNTATSLGAARSLSMSLQRLSAAGRPAQEPIHVEPTTWYNPELRTAVYIVPGLIGVILTMTMVFMIIKYVSFSKF